MTYKLLQAFESLFAGKIYRHRDSTQGDQVASFLADDIYSLNRSPKLKAAIDNSELVLNTANKAVGLKHRRGDGTFGIIVPGEAPLHVATYTISLGDVANTHIGAEVKILAKAMIKQLDRVGTDMINQATEYKQQGNNPICVGVVGVNYATQYTGYEGDKHWPTDGKKHKHPIQEAAAAEARLLTRVRPSFDELLCLRFIATNTDPFDFVWVDEQETNRQYGAALVRLASMYERRF